MHKPSRNQKSNPGILPDIAELLSMQYQARNIQLLTRHRVQTQQSGNYLSHAGGRGMDFDEVRLYQPGDDIRLMHWGLTARLGKPYTKVYKEERECSVQIVIDQTQSMKFGTKVCFKSVLASKIMSVLGWASLLNHQQIGGVVFDETGFSQIRPSRSRQSLLRLFKAVSDENYPLKKHQPANLNRVLERLSQQIQTGSIVIVISDYMQFDEQSERYLKLITQKSTVMQIFTYDPLEKSLPEKGLYRFSDGKTQFLDVNANSHQQSQQYGLSFAKRIERVRRFSRQYNMLFMEISTNDNLVKALNQGARGYGY